MKVKKQHSHKEKRLQASIPMTIMDSLPVLCFCNSIFLLHRLFPSPSFLLGAIFCIIAGLSKVIWKLVLAIRKKSITWLNRQFHVFMPVGMLLLVGSLIIDRHMIHWAAVWQDISQMPVSILLIIAFTLMLVMAYCAVKADQDSEKVNWIEQSVQLAAQLCILVAVSMIVFGNHA